MHEREYLKTALAVVKKCGPLFKTHFGKAGKPQIKNHDPRHLVTKIDLAIEKSIRQTVKKKFKNAKFIGEEFGRSEIQKDDTVWVIDPIDGTTNYIRGIPFCCISIGVWDKHGPLAGVVYNPVLEQTYTALRGKGAFLNGKKISVSKISRLTEASGAIGWLTPEAGKKIFGELIEVSRKLRVLASSAWQVCLVASGQLDYYATHDVNIWDVAGPICILNEAGGKFTGSNNETLNLELTEIIATNAKIHVELLSQLKT